MTNNGNMEKSRSHGLIYLLTLMNFDRHYHCHCQKHISKKIKK